MLFVESKKYFIPRIKLNRTALEKNIIQFKRTSRTSVIQADIQRISSFTLQETK